MNNEIIISNHTPQDITITQDENQLIFINGGGEVIGVTDVKVNGNSVVTNNIAYVIVPTKTSDLTNDSGYITTETDPTVPSYVKAITKANINNWNNKQDTLVSGTNIKTINNNSLLGSGNIDITGGESYTAGNGIDINNNVISNTITNYNDLTDLPTIPNKTSDLINDSNFVDSEDLAEVSFTGSYNSLSDTPIIPDSTSDLVNDSNFITSQEVSTEIQTAIATKQDTLVSGTNIKTVNNNSLLGSGDLQISGANYVAGTGINITGNTISNTITSYNDLSNLPSIPNINTINFGGGIWFNVVLAGGSGWRLVIPIQNPNNVQPTVNLSASYFGTTGWSSCTISVAGYSQTFISLAFDNITNITGSETALLISIAGTITI